MRKIFLSLVFLLILINFSYAQNISGLSIEECLTLALTNHPSLRRAKSSTRNVMTQLERTKAANRVTVGLTGSARYNGNYDDADNNNHNESLSVTASKLLYDTGRNRLQREIDIESINSSLETEKDTQITVAANAKKAYYDLVLKILNRDVEREKVNNLEEHLKNAQGLYEVGNSPFVDVTKAQSDLASARVSLLKAENDILVSQESLRVAMGTDINGDFDIILSTKLLLPQPAEDIDTLISTAMKDRPDYQKLLHDLRGKELSIKDAARSSSPTITGQAGSGVSKTEGADTSSTYNLGLSLNLPIIDGGTMKASVESARAQADQVEADIDSLKQQLTYDIRSAVLSLSNATDRVKSSEALVKYSEENLELEQGRYEVGVGNSISLSDAVSLLASSRYTYYQALYDAQVARANLDQALGHFPPEIQEILQ